MALSNIAGSDIFGDVSARKQAEEALLTAETLQKAIFNSANFSSIATDANGVIQIFNVGAERMLGYTAEEVTNKITPADLSDPQEVIARAKALSVELQTQIAPGFEALVFKASRGIEDIYELTYIRKDGSRFPAVVSVTALRDAQDAIIGYLLIGTDNTARKQAEEALLKAGALQSAIFNSANFSSIATDAKGVIQIFNVGAERMLGYTAEEVLNKITPADISDPQEIIARAQALSVELQTEIAPGFEALVFKASRGIEDIYELTYIRKDGSRLPAILSVTALRDAQGGIIGYLTIGTDNSARKRAEEDRNRFFALSPDALCTLGFDGYFKDLNPAWEKTLGYTKAELLATPFIELVHPDDRQSTLAEAENVAGGKALLAFENRYRCKDGSYRWFQWSVTPAIQDRVMYGVARDVTMRKQAEEALLKAGALQSAIFNSANFSSIATDAKGVIQLFNVGAERMLGYTAAEVLNKITLADISDAQEIIARAQALSVELQTEIAPGFEALVFKASRGIEDIYELTYIRKDGSRLPAILSVTALRDAQGGIIGYLTIGTDNSARKRAEEDRNRFFALSPDALCTLGFDGYFKDLNPAWEKTLGYTKAELLATPFIELVHPDDRQITLAEAENVAGGKALLAFENRYRCKDGSYRWFQWSVTPAIQDRVMYGVARDVTMRKQAEEALLKGGALQSAIFNSANFSSIATDAKGVIQPFNVGAERMLGYTAAEVLNKITLADISDAQEIIARAQALSVELQTEIAPGFEALVFKASRGIEDIYELTYIRKDGSRLPAILSVTALRDAQGGIIGYLTIGTDNSARKRAEEDRNRFFALSPDALCTLGFDGYFKDLNPAWEKTLGYTKAELLATPFIELVHPDDRQSTLAEAENVAGGKALLAFENRYRCKDGSYRWFQWSVTPAIQDRVMYGVARDVTMRKQAEEALLKAGALQSAIFNSANFSSIATDAKGVIQIFNVGAERMLGYTAAEVLNKITPADISDPQEIIARAQALSVELQTEIAPGFEALVFKASRGIEDIYELTYIRKDGSRLPAILSVTALRDAQGGIIGYLTIGTDNSARKRAEEDRNRFFALSPDALCTLGFDGYFKDLNPAWEKTLGYTKAELLATPFIELVHPDDRQSTLAEAENVAGGKALLAFENRYRCKDGSYRWFQWSVTPAIQDRVMYGVARDVTMRKQAEEALLKAGALQSAIFNSANFSSIATDAKGVIQLFNVGAERMLGYTAAEVLNKITLADISDAQEIIARAQALSVELQTEIAPGFEALVFKASRGIEDIYELTYIRKDGSRLPAILSVTALRDAQGGIIGYLTIGTDNSARKRAEEDRNRFFALSPDALCTLGFDGYFKDLNPAWEKTLGYTKAELLATPFIELVHPDDRQITLAETQNVAGGKALLAFENRYRCKDGSYRWFQSSITPAIQDRVMYGVARDVTMREQAEEALLKAGALQSAIFNSANFSSIATDAKGVIQLFNVGAERMLGYTAAEVLNKITPADISDPQEIIARAQALSVELQTEIAP